MADVYSSVATVCGRCGQRVAARGGRAPVFCAVCGQRLTPLSANVEHRFEPAPNVEHRFRHAKSHRSTGQLSLFLGLCSLIPTCGFPVALLAIPTGMVAVTEKGDDRSLGAAGAILGCFALLLHIACWASWR